MEICRLCLKANKLVKAHIVPRAFFANMIKSSGALKIYGRKLAYPVRSQSGPYDSTILCGECDNKLGKNDEYAYHLLSNPAKFETISESSKPLAHKIEAYDYHKLKSFCISILWRASISTRVEFRNVKIGPFEPRARALLWSGNPGSPDDFSTVATLLIERKDLSPRTWISPIRSRVMGLNGYRIYLPGYVFFIKVDQRQFIEDIKELVLRPDLPLYILHDEMKWRKEYQILIQSIREKIGCSKHLQPQQARRLRASE